MPGGGLRVFGSADGTADGDAACSGGDDFREVFRVNSPDGIGGERTGTADVANQIETDEFLEGLGFRGEDRSDADVIRTVAEGLFGLFDRMSRDADEALRANDAAGIKNAEFFLADMDAIGVNQNGEVGAVVHDEEGAEFAGPFADASTVLDEFAVGHRFFSNLDDSDAGLKRSADDGSRTATAEVFGDEEIEGM